MTLAGPFIAVGIIIGAAFIGPFVAIQAVKMYRYIRRNWRDARSIIQDELEKN